MSNVKRHCKVSGRDFGHEGYLLQWVKFAQCLKLLSAAILHPHACTGIYQYRTKLMIIVVHKITFFSHIELDLLWFFLSNTVSFSYHLFFPPEGLRKWQALFIPIRLSSYEIFICFATTKMLGLSCSCQCLAIHKSNKHSSGMSVGGWRHCFW